MPAIPWNPSFSVAHAELDRQHMEVLTLMNEMEKLLVSAPGNYERKKRLHILERLLDYGNRHSALEMRVLRQWGCDEDSLHRHWRAHKDFDTRVYALFRQLLAGELVLDSAILAAIRHEFFHHILMEDRPLLASLRLRREAGREESHPRPGSPWPCPASLAPAALDRLTDTAVPRLAA